MHQAPGFNKLIALIISLAAVGQLTNTIIIPAMSHIANSFAINASYTQAIIACYLLPYGLLQFVYGPISDRVGRRPTILAGLIIFIAGSLLAWSSHNFHLLLAASALQGAGIAVAGVMSRTLTRDHYSGNQLHHANSIISTTLMVAPLIAPLIGSLLTHLFDWESIYLFLALFGLMVYVFQQVKFSESNHHIHSTTPVLKRYQTLIKDKRFSFNMLYLVISFGGIAVFETFCGALLTDTFHMSPFLTSLLFIIPLPALMAGSYLVKKMIHRKSAQDIIQLGIIIVTIGSISMLTASILGFVNLYVIFIPACIYFLGTGLIFPTATTQAMQHFPQFAGSAGALLGGMQNATSGLLIIIAANLPIINQLPLAIILSSLSMSLLILMTQHQKAHVRLESAMSL